MAGRVIDFDAFRRERDARLGEEVEPVFFRIGGKDYRLPDEPPATLTLDVIRMKEDQGKDVAASIKALTKIGESLFGKDQFREILETHKVGAAELGDLIIQAFQAWPDVDIEDAVPNRAARRAQKRSTSSRTGRASKRTSRGNTR